MQRIEKVQRMELENGVLVEVSVSADRSSVMIGIQTSSEEDRDSDQMTTVYANLDFESAKSFQKMLRDSIRSIRKAKEEGEES